MPDLAFLLPPGVDLSAAGLLIVLSAFTSLITATFSLGGGTLMIAVLALVFPPAVVVPLHGGVQLGSNAGRALVQRQFIQWRYVMWIALGAAIGTVFGGQIAQFLPEHLFQIAIALFVLVTTWLPNPKVNNHGPVAQFLGGAIISALGMVVGAVGPLIAIFLRHLPDRRELVATHAALMSIQNVFKVGVFTALGFAFADYLPLLVAMILSGFVGTAIGSRLLLKVPEKLFRYGFRIVLTLVALDLLRDAIWG